MDILSKTPQTFLVTGSAGFIGFHLAKRLLENGHIVHGVDLMTASYYDPLLKDARLNVLETLSGYTHHKIDLADTASVKELQVNIGKIDVIIHLAAQACVLRSFEFPHEYVQDNIVAFQNMLELYSHNDTGKFMYASSSSVYGQSKEGSVIFEDKKTDLPVSIYGASKIANEAMAQAYYSYYQKPLMGLRFFKVYGPWARPDTVFFKFVDLMYKNEPIKLHNHGRIQHSFTYINDIADCLIQTATSPQKEQDFNSRHPIYNFGGKSVLLEDCVKAMETAMGKDAIREPVPLPHGDRWYTFADSSAAHRDLNFNPDTSINEGIKDFVDWYINEYVPIMDDIKNI
jgi:UDP-glucuronate 4-epimerase